MKLRVGLATVLVLVAAVLGVRGVLRVRRSLASSAVCDAVESGNPQRALQLTQNLSGTDPYSLRATECRCAALMETGRREECVGLLEDILARPEVGDWLPMPLLTAVLAEYRRDRGSLLEATDLAHRGAISYPDDVVLFLLELDLRGRLENKTLVLQEMRHRLAAAGAAEPRLRLELGAAYLNLKGYDDTLELLGDEAPADPGLLRRWTQLRMAALAGLGRIDAVEEAVSRGETRGLDPLDLRAFAAVVFSLNSLTDPGLTTTERLQEAVANLDRLQDRQLAKTVYYRYVGSLVVDDRYDEALTAYDRGMEEFGDLFGLTRDTLLRSRTQGLLSEEEMGTQEGTLVFRLTQALPGDVLLLSPGPRAPVDTDFEVLAVPRSRRLEARRRIGTAPQRWVLRDQAGRPVGSGTVWPQPSASVEVQVERRRPVAEPRSFSLQPQPADGRLRIFVVVLDCGDWRLVQYGRARGDLPVLEAFIDTGQSAVLTSDPPFTAVAIEALAVPGRKGVSSFAGMLHQLGTEVAALNFVGRNPASGLAWILPRQEGLFSLFGSTGLATVNLLRSFGPLQVGRNAQVIGPRGEVRQITSHRGSRRLTPREVSDFSLDLDEAALGLVEEIAADFDALLDLVTNHREIDLVLLRVASLDVLTHHFYDDIAVSGQDDGRRPLFRLYRYVDTRLGEVFNVLDEDDLLVVLSDHGIRTSLEHDRRAFFVAVGGGVPKGRVEGSPELRGIGRMLADLLGVEVPWPATGIEAWVGEMSDKAPSRAAVRP